MESDPRPGITRLFVLRAGLLPTFVGVLTVGALAWSVARDVPHTLDTLRSQHAGWSDATRHDRDVAFGNAIPIDMSVLDYWRNWLRPGDRYWIQMPYEPFSSFGDKRALVQSVARLYLLPAVETPRLANADVVLSWNADPGLLHRRFSAQERAGLQLIFYSRIANDS